MGPFIIFAVIILIAILLVVSNIYVVQQSRAYVIERLGAFERVDGVGIHVKFPFIDRVARRVSLKEQVLDYPPQPVITKDNVTMQIDTVVYFQITDPKLYTYGVEQPMAAMETLTATTLRNIIGDLELDQTLTSRDVVNTKMRAILDVATDPWGIKVNRVELKNILPPQDIQNSMEKQMKAERDRRQAILQAEGQRKSAILIAEGEKEAAILRASADKEAAILKAEAEKQSAILKAAGEAEAIREVQQALADSLKMLNEAAPNDSVLKLKAIEAMQKVADGQATKIIIPSDIQNMAGLIASIKEVAADAPAEKPVPAAPAPKKATPKANSSNI
jgi:regulator of protease activity HflC (stomatin/prohibitin superfamily)